MGMSENTCPIRFSAEVLRVHERIIVRLPAEASAELPSRGQVSVSGTVNGRDFSTVVEPDGLRGHWISVDAKMAEQLGEAGDDLLDFELQPTKVWPEPQLPHDLADALRDAGDLDEVWASLTPMARWEWVRWVQATKNATTRLRRVEVTVSKLHDGKRRPCCFDLSSCTDPQLAKSGKLAIPG